MYGNSLRLLKDVATTAFPVVVALIVLEVLVEQNVLTGNFFSAGFVDVIAYACIAFVAHVAVLFPDRKTDPELTKKIGGFLWRVFLMNLPLFVAAFLVVILAMSFVDTLDASNKEEVKVYAGILLLPVAGLLFLLIFGFTGTLLPAFIYGKNQGLGRALGREKWPVIWRIIVGPGLLNILIIIIAFGAAALELLKGSFFQENWAPNVADIIINVILYMISVWGVVMLAYILSTEYIKAEGIIPGAPDHAPQEAVNLTQMD